MNLDYLFPVRSTGKLEVIRTDRLGNPRGAFSTKLGATKHSQYPDLKQAVYDMVETLAVNVSPLAVVALGPQEMWLASILPHGSVWLDIKQLAWPLVLHTAISKDRNFDELCREFQVTEENGDCVTLSQLYFAMMARYKSSLFGEQLIRNAGGKALGSVRKLFGV